MTFVTESEMKRCNISSIKRKCHSELVQYSSFIAVLKRSIENLFHSFSFYFILFLIFQLDVQVVFRKFSRSALGKPWMSGCVQLFQVDHQELQKWGAISRDLGPLGPAGWKAEESIGKFTNIASATSQVLEQRCHCWPWKRRLRCFALNHVALQPQLLIFFTFAALVSHSISTYPNSLQK